MGDTYTVIDNIPSKMSFYVTPDGTGEGVTPDEPGNLFDVLDRMIGSNIPVTIYCFPGTYDFARRNYIVRGTTTITIFTYDPNNTGDPVILTRAAGSGPMDGVRMFNAYDSANILFWAQSTGGIIFDKWVDGSYNDDTTDLPFVWSGRDNATVTLYGNITIRASKVNVAKEAFVAVNGRSLIKIHAINSYGHKLTFDGLGSVSSDSTAEFALFRTITGDAAISFVDGWGTHAYEFKCHGIGEWLIPFIGRLRSFGGQLAYVSFDILRGLLKSEDYNGYVYFRLTHQAYNNDGTVNTSGVGGTDYYVTYRFIEVFRNGTGNIFIYLDTDVHVSNTTYGSFVSLHGAATKINIGSTIDDTKRVVASYGNGGVTYSSFFYLDGDHTKISVVGYPVTFDGNSEVWAGIFLLYTSAIYSYSLKFANCTYGVYIREASSATFVALSVDTATTGVVVTTASSARLVSTTLANADIGLEVSSASRVSKVNTTYTNCTTNESVSAGSVVE